jgi:hypothetical protein
MSPTCLIEVAVMRQMTRRWGLPIGVRAVPELSSFSLRHEINVIAYFDPLRCTLGNKGFNFYQIGRQFLFPPLAAIPASTIDTFVIPSGDQQRHQLE